MSQYDLLYAEQVRDIVENGEWDKDGEVRTVYSDGSPAYTKSIFGAQMKMDGSEPPIITTKKLFAKTSYKELWLFWVLQTVKQDDFENHNVKVWQQWFNEQRNLGRAYAYQFESHRHHDREIVKVKPRVKEKGAHHKEFFVVGEDIEAVSNHKLCGKILDSKYGLFKVIKHSKEDDRFLIQFLNSKYSYEVARQDMLKANVKDPYVKTSFGGYGAIGIPSNVKNIKKEHYKKILRIWQNMMKRCYNESGGDYHMYGEKGVFVDDRWHCFEYFLRDLRYLPQYFLAREDGFKGWHLDKDYYGSNCYSAETCVWLKSSDNSSYRNDVSPFYLVDKEGKKELFLNIKDASCKHGLDRGDLSRLLNGKLKSKSIKGFTVERVEDDGYLYRRELSRNQVVELLKNIKRNPYSRRLETNFWNFADVDKKQLQECAFGTQFNIRNGRLDLLLRQRSGDIGLGIVFNAAQYYFLQCMIAQVCNLKVGTFTHQIGNLHYYDRHEESLLKQIQGTMYPAPKLWINPEVTDFFDFSPDDIKLIDYQCGEYIPMEVAI